MKKLALFCTVALVSVGLAGCGSNSSSSKSASSSSHASSKVVNSQSQNQNSSSQNANSNNNQSDDSIKSLQPRQVAAAVLDVGAQSNPSWKNLESSSTNGDGDLRISYYPATTDGDQMVTETGTGMFYELTLDGNNGLEINGYTMSNDGKTIYLYSEGEHDSGERTMKPFATISASQVIQAAKKSNVNDIANNAHIKN